MDQWLRRIRGAVGMGLTWAGMTGGILELVANISPGLRLRTAITLTMHPGERGLGHREPRAGQNGGGAQVVRRTPSPRRPMTARIGWASLSALTLLTASCTSRPQGVLGSLKESARCFALITEGTDSTGRDTTIRHDTLRVRLTDSVMEVGGRTMQRATLSFVTPAQEWEERGGASGWELSDNALVILHRIPDSVETEYRIALSGPPRVGRYRLRTHAGEYEIGVAYMVGAPCN